MKIVIVRHAKVLIKNKKIYANELKKAIEEYDYTDKKIMKLSLFTWAFWFKLAWYMGFSGGAKSYQESKDEAFKASKILIDLAKEYGSVMLMGHGLKNRLIATALRQQGWIERKKMKMDNLDYGVFILS